MARLEVAPLAMEAWARRRRRAGQLLERYPFAAQLLRLYGALLDVQERAFLTALHERPAPATAGSLREPSDVVPAVADATVAAGPAALADAVGARLRDGDAAGLVSAWLAGEQQAPVDAVPGAGSQRASAGGARSGGRAGAVLDRPARDARAAAGCPRSRI